jgi:hypothetical protein
MKSIFGFAVENRCTFARYNFSPHLLSLVISWLGVPDRATSAPRRVLYRRAAFRAQLGDLRIRRPSRNIVTAITDLGDSRRLRFGFWHQRHTNMNRRSMHRFRFNGNASIH